MTYIQNNSVPRANLGVLDKLIAARHEMSQVCFVYFREFFYTLYLIHHLLTNHFPLVYIIQIMGYKSYVDYALHSNMASSPDVVSSFLADLSKTVRSKADEVLFLKGYFSNRFQ